MNALRLSVHAKLRGTVEVRAFLALPGNPRHRIGTWCLPATAWRHWVRSMLERGGGGVRGRSHD